MSDEQNRRRHHRRDTTLSAQILLSGAELLDCTLRNLSAGGAQLTFEEPVELQEAFVLEVPALDLHVKARLIWSQGQRHGVEFLWPQHNEHGGRPSR
jgi:c-di-GMP-binding flagellar brake protein YcgR